MMYFWTIPIAVIVLAVLYFMQANDGFSFGRKKDTPLEILRRRFAKGEITKQEFEERKRVLLEDEY